MRQSKNFTKATKDLPKDETSFNAQALIRAGFIDKLSAGVYTYLPLGLRVLRKI
jgi:prolyl-tRNA synthetase